MPLGHYMQLASQSRLASRLMVVRGVIDSKFHGEVQALILTQLGRDAVQSEERSEDLSRIIPPCTQGKVQATRRTA